MRFFEKMKAAVENGISLQRALDVPAKDEIARAKIHPSETFGDLAKDLENRMDQQFNALSTEALEKVAV